MERPENNLTASDADHIRVVEEAAAWFTLMHGGKPSREDRKSLKEWLAADARHADAYASVERLWEGSLELPSLKERHLAVQKTISRRRLGKAVVATAVGLGGWRYFASHPFADYQTATGERRTANLVDGSAVDLAAETKLSVSFTPAKRGITLHEGEAFFTVAPDAERPFVVEAGSGRTLALGTAFGVDYRDDSVTVIVTKNTVNVSVGNESKSVAAGSVVTYGRDHIGATHDSELGTELAWREGRLVFAQAPLGEAVRALNRWRSGRLIVMSGALAARPITLIVNLDRLDTIVPQLAEAVPMRVVNVTPYMTLLFSAG
jgi:transmembrane sensor